MKQASAIIVLLGLLGATLAAPPPPLPQWDDEDFRLLESRQLRLGGTLFPLRDDTQAMDEVEHTEIPMEPAEIPEVVTLGVVRDLPADLVETYFPEKLEARVLDPQSQLTQTRLEGILHFLDYHFREARSAIHILVLKPMQRLPSHLDLEEIHERWFGDSLSVLVVYNFGNPGMSRLIFGKDTERRVSEGRRVNACIESINEAMIASNAEDQLERFLTELSRKLYWIEDIYHGEVAREARDAPTPKIEASPPVDAAVSTKTLWFTILSIAAVLIMLGAGIVALQRHSASKTFYFPERRHFPRLGAPVGGGNRLIVSFGPAKEKPKAM